jgi:hypothetical protein
MSKERELLKRWFSEFGKIHADIKLLRDTQTLLAQPEQPEQTEQEPVAWMWDEMFCEDWTTVSSVIKPSKSKYVDNVRPLYLAPPKREPLINIYVLNAFKADDEATHPYSYWAGVEFAEKHHGIGGGE